MSDIKSLYEAAIASNSELYLLVFSDRFSPFVLNVKHRQINGMRTSNMHFSLLMDLSWLIKEQISKEDYDILKEIL